MHVRQSLVHWFRQWLVAWSVPSHYLNQCWYMYMVNSNLRNRFQWNLNCNLNIFIQGKAFENVWKMAAILSWPQCVNSLWPSETVWLHTFGSTFAQVMTCYLTTLSHCLNQCLLNHRWCAVTISWGQLHKRYLSHQLLKFALRLLTSSKFPNIVRTMNQNISEKNYSNNVFSLTLLHSTH